MKKIISKTPAKKAKSAKATPAKTVAKQTKSAKATPAKTVAKQTKPDKPTKMDKLNKLERAYAEKQLSREEYEMWKNIYLKEGSAQEYITEEAYRPRKTRRRPY